VIILPRQARDKHRESPRKREWRFSQEETLPEKPTLALRRQKYCRLPSLAPAIGMHTTARDMGAKSDLCPPVTCTENDHFTKTGSGQT
jgi:hypothetical protein